MLTPLREATRLEDSFWGGAAVGAVNTTVLADSIWPVAPQGSDETVQV